MQVINNSKGVDFISEIINYDTIPKGEVSSSRKS